MIKINTSNIKKVTKAIEKYGDDAIETIEGVVSGIAYNIQDNAKELAQAKKVWDLGGLVDSIKVEKQENNLTYRVTSYAPYSAYMEFGTGAKVQVPTEFKDIASKFRGKSKGSFQEGLNSIKIWCKHKNIDEKYAYIIFITILNEGIAPRPFMYPAFVYGRMKFNKELRDELKELSKHFNNG